MNPTTTETSRFAAAHLEIEVTDTADIVFSVAVATGPQVVAEQLTIIGNGVPLEFEEVSDSDGARLHVVRNAPVGTLTLDYTATVTGTSLPQPISRRDEFVYLRPSRYCDSDTLAPTAASDFRGLTGRDLVDAVSSWVGERLLYVSGSSRPIDGAVQTYLARTGVCRDYAHLVIALLRARGVPARLVSVYAPGLSPMDFHAVAEAQVEGSWHVLDATCLAPRQSMLRIATGRDAADTAFMSTTRGGTNLLEIQVTATVAPTLPLDDVHQLVQLS